jgi:predicted homoserine dehydrogenase-like protein
LPLGLAHGVKLLRDVTQGDALTWNDVAYDADDGAVKVRREMEAMFAPAPVPA